MTENLNSWNTVTNQWLKFWSESSSVIWDNWFTLLGLEPKSETTEVGDEDNSDSQFQQSAQENANLIDNYVKKLIRLTELSQKVNNWKQVQKLWLDLADILLYYNSEHTSEKLSNFIHDIEKIELVNLEKEILSDNPIEQNNSLQKDSGFNSFELLPQVKLAEKKLKLNKTENFTDKEQEYREIEQDEPEKSQTIEELKARIIPLEEKNELSKNHQIISSKKDDFANLSEALSQVQRLEYQLQLKEEALKISEHKIINKAKENWELQQENQEKSQKIEQLNTKIGELESIAAIGNQQLNKWRFKTFFN